MTPLRQREKLLAELTGLQQLLRSTPEDPIATPLLASRIEDLKQRLDSLESNAPLNPEAEMFFSDGPTIGSDGLDVIFASEVLNSYQNMLTNHYAAVHYGDVRRTGRRRGEEDTRLYLTALPRGSFGLQLSQPYVPDFIAAGNVSTAMKDISGLIRDTATSDEAFEAALPRFDARVFKPLKRFIVTVHTGGGSCRLVTGDLEVVLSPKAISEAYIRILAAVTDDKSVEVIGVFGGAQVFSGSFEFQPDLGDLIRGSLDPDLTEEAATNMSRDFTNRRAIARMKMTTVSTRAGKKRPTYELTELLPAPGPSQIEPPPPSDEKRAAPQTDAPASAP